MKAAVGYAILGTSLVGLFGGTYAGVSMARGAPASELPLLGKLFPEPPKPEAPAEPEHEQETAADEHAKAKDAKEEESDEEHAPVDVGAKHPLSASALGSFLLPEPFGAEELTRIERTLHEKSSELEKRLAAVGAREKALEDRERALDSRAEELRAMLDRVAVQDAPPANAGKAEAPPKKPAEAKPVDDEDSWSDLARFFADGDAEAAGKRLAAYDPKDAAHILRALDEDRATEIVLTLSPDRAKPLLDAYRATPRSSTGGEAPKN